MYYGCDSGSDGFPCGANFYLGRLGQGKTADSTYFNSAAAQTVGSSNTYSYWGIQGPTADPNYEPGNTSEATTWGENQAKAFVTAWDNQTLTDRYTLFGDVESGFGGWLAAGNALNHAVYEGFMTYINQLDAVPSFVSGVYSSYGEWANIMGSGYSISPANVEWAANWLTSCNVCPSSMSGVESFGGATPAIWQYNGCNKDCTTTTPSPCPYDLDVSASLPS